MQRFTPKALHEAAARLGVDVAVIRAVAAVEAAGSGFLKSGKPKILFEAHLFDRETKGVYRAAHPTLSSARWDRTLYRGGEAEWARYTAAYDLDPEAAMRSTSWGAFQILGSNHRACGFARVGDMVAAMQQSEDAHLLAFAAFVAAHPAMAKALRGHQWADFARRYNGPGFAANQYDTKLAAAFARELASAQSEAVPGEQADTRAVQAALNARGAALTPDGYAGPRTRAAVASEQEAQPGLAATGTLDARTRAALDLPALPPVIRAGEQAVAAAAAVSGAATALGGVPWQTLAVLAAAALVAGGVYAWHRARQRRAAYT